MIADIYDTLRGILQSELPKNSEGKTVVFDQPITGWYYGDQSVLTETPAIVIQGTTSSPKDTAMFGLKEVTHTITIYCWTRLDSNEITEKQALEFSRLIYEALFPHRRLWVMTKCPICLKWVMSPLHYVNSSAFTDVKKKGHSDIFGSLTDAASSTGSYVAKSKYAINAIWRQTHNYDMSSYNNSGLASEAFYMMYDDVLANTPQQTVAVSAIAANGTITTSANHGLSIGTPVKITTTSGSISSATTYYVRSTGYNASSTSLTLTTSSDGSGNAVTGSSSGSNTLTVQYPVGLSASVIKNIQSYLNKKRKPIRLIYDGVFTDIKPCEKNLDQVFYRGGEFTFSAKELIKVSAFGPDNVSTDAWS